MPTQSAIVTSFFEEWSKGRSAMLRSFRDFFTDRAIWENVGIAVTTGPDEAIAFFNQALEAVRCDYMEVEILHIAATQDTVLTERIDRFISRDGKPLDPVRVMGILEIRGDRISAWRDYFDPRPFLAMAGQ